MGVVENLLESEPSGTRWTLLDGTRCGIRAFQRPCQSPQAAEMPGADFPTGPLCASENEYVFVVEDEEDSRSELVELVEGMGRKVIACATAGELNAVLSRATTGCILLDIKMQGGDGISVLEQLKENRANLAVIVVSGLRDPVIAAECIKLGAMEYVVKPANEMVLRRLIDRAIGQSRSAYCRSQSKALVVSMLEKLTPAEEKIAELLSQGYPTKMIAGQLGRSENTIKIHRHRIMSKLKVNSVASLANLYNHVRG